MKPFLLFISIAFVCIGSIWSLRDGEEIYTPNSSLSIPVVGTVEFRAISPKWLELTYINTVDGQQPPKTWHWVDENNTLHLPAFDDLEININGNKASIGRLGFKRRVRFASHKKYDLRIRNQLFIELNAEISDQDQVVLLDPRQQLGLDQKRWQVDVASDRLSPVIHVNQNGYYPTWSKKAMVGYYLGNLGELTIPEGTPFRIDSVYDKTTLYEGELTHRPDKGYEYPVLPYQLVYEADFSSVTTPGEYRLIIPGLGASWPFFINDGVPAMMARTYALGLYHQRCGVDNRLPYTRFSHDICHVKPVEIPTANFAKVNRHLSEMSKRGKNDPKQIAPVLSSVDAALYPFIRRGSIQAQGGHHDAGDYSKYTIHSAQFIHHLVFAADAFPQVISLDNLGLPESGDGISDLIQIAKWEADFLLQMQDDDGGFYFLVYPRDRKYETNVLPENGDPQVVFPKNTSATAAASAALAQIGSSDYMKRTFPEESRRYLKAALKGWQFIENAHRKFGTEGAYQKVTHYGDVFGDEDERVWAATELYLATGQKQFHKYILDHFNPSDRATQRWGWVRLYGGFGNAIRSYGFASKSGRQSLGQLDQVYLKRCMEQIIAGGEDQANYAAGNAYGISFPMETKRFKTAGWFLAMDAVFDIVVASTINKDRWFEHILTNASFEGGVNPNNLSFVTGTGWQHPVEIVHQVAQNDNRFLPPTGIPIGNIQRSFEGHKPYGRYLNNLSFPHDEDEISPYPFYDRSGDTFNTRTEATIVKQARGLAGYACLMAKTEYKNQKWETRSLTIKGLPESIARDTVYPLEVNGLGINISQTRIRWESSVTGPYMGQTFPFKSTETKDGWIEAEVLWPDGHRSFIRRDYRM